ncbi:DNA adenine methylase [Williamwhitmania taraxaci]|uniref:D12 class N6 adenine-specific DNA methyltransferase n=1 Tax=Williamwhitmania taraxaci TaxID=1640674 RepID=A0A1G6M929_9BACT|nr:DNA adenine methylase [Williamwhitmania taraxaci]SDC52013.1 D12 class N6 adenine-specific DNA methyltransferase [Williamwhitmania taraxaci]
MNKKNYTSAPLPFMGQKRRFVGEFKRALREFPEGVVFIDLFGGSGLLSHIAKQERPSARVVYNDFDGYTARISNVEKTNRILQKLRVIVADIPTDKKIPKEVCSRIFSVLEEEEKGGCVDYVTLSSSLLFSMKYATGLDEMRKSTLYNCVRKSDYTAVGYLDGVETVCSDYSLLFEQYKNQPGVVFFVDPPYLSTEVGVYSCCWKLSNYLDVLKVLRNTSFFYFTSTKSNIEELLQWVEQNLNSENPLSGSTRCLLTAYTGNNVTFTDVMHYKVTTTSLPVEIKTTYKSRLIRFKRYLNYTCVCRKSAQFVLDLCTFCFGDYTSHKTKKAQDTCLGFSVFEEIFRLTLFPFYYWYSSHSDQQLHLW